VNSQQTATSVRAGEIYPHQGAVGQISTNRLEIRIVDAAGESH